LKILYKWYSVDLWKLHNELAKGENVIKKNLVIALIFILFGSVVGCNSSERDMVQEMTGKYYVTAATVDGVDVNHGESYLQLTIDPDGYRKGSLRIGWSGMQAAESIENWVYDYGERELLVEYTNGNMGAFEVIEHGKMLKVEESGMMIIYEKD